MDLLDTFKAIVAEDVGDAIKTTRLFNPQGEWMYDALNLWPEHKPDYSDVGGNLKSVGNTALNAASFVPVAAVGKIGKAGAVGVKTAMKEGASAARFTKKAYQSGKQTRNTVREYKNLRAQSKSLKNARTGRKYIDNFSRKWAKAYIDPEAKTMLRKGITEGRQTAKYAKIAAQDAFSASKKGAKAAYKTYKKSKKVRKKVAVGVAAQGTSGASRENKRNVPGKAQETLNRYRPYY